MARDPLMAEALMLARKGIGRTSPNPAVGALIVRSGRIIARGFHRKAGLPHAEIEALSKIKSAKGATLYVTLEPCCTFGRTPPCTDSIIAAGIKKVVIGAPDPNPRVSGRGVKALRDAGVEVVEGVLKDECESINRHYNKHITTGTPFVTLKLATSLDGRIATSRGESRWITGAEARKIVHRMRSVHDAVMAGSVTVVKDDPLFTVRLAKGRDPVRVVLDSRMRVPVNAKVFSGVKEGRARLIIFTTRKAARHRAEKALRAGAEVVIVPAAKDGVSINRVLKELGDRGFTSVLAEGGGRLAETLLKAGAVDRLVLFMAPLLLGGDAMPSIAGLGLKSLKNAPRLKSVSVKRAGDDIMIDGYPDRKN